MVVKIFGRGEIRFSIFDLGHLSKLSHFPPGMTDFLIFTAKKELIFFLSNGANHRSVESIFSEL